MAAGNKINVMIKTPKCIVFLERCPKNFKTPMHTHKNNETFIMLHGSGMVHSGDNGIININTWPCISPGVHHMVDAGEEGLICIGILHGDYEEELEAFYDYVVGPKK
jgi:mannose-6-phosphate isomerase-like protein (cupin superfamily)